MAKRDGRKGPRTAKQKAATARMLAALRAKRGGKRTAAKHHTGGRKKPRTAKQKAATARMLAGLRASRGVGGGKRHKKGKRGPGRPKGSHTKGVRVGGVVVSVSVKKA